MNVGLFVTLVGCPWIDPKDVSDQIDADHDGFAELAFDGADCDDTDPEVHPGASEVWYDGVDQDCSGGSDDDQDGDGLVAAQDCDDEDRAVGGAEVLHADADHDGYGDPNTPITACDPPSTAIGDDRDCDDTDPEVHPGATEVCGGGDEDCNGAVDDADPDLDTTTWSSWYADADADGFAVTGSDPVAEACAGPPGSTSAVGDCDDEDPRRSPAALESCNGADDDCDTLVDDDDPSVDPSEAGWYADVDGDGFGNQDTIWLSCDPVPSRIRQGGDCNDHDPAVYPAAVETCGLVDEDCDGLVDEADPDLVASTWYTDADGDGAGALPVAAVACVGPADSVPAADDCDDGDPDVSPGAPETCDGADDDCDLLVDDDDPELTTSLFVDTDGDGYGQAPVTTCDPTPDPAWVSVGGDCDDASPTIHPGRVETWYDGVDEDCSGGSDYDADGDGVQSPTDCDDVDPTKTGTEVWYDGVDQDCDGQSDFDQDRDGDDDLAYGGTDCLDTDPATHPGAAEIWYDDLDQGCDGGSDHDQDQDGIERVPNGIDCDDTDPAVVDGGLVTLSFPGADPTLEEAIDRLGCDYGVVEIDAAYITDSQFTRASIDRPVTLRGAGPTNTVFENARFDVHAALTLESLALTQSDQTPIVSVGSDGPVTLLDVDCSGNRNGCIQTDTPVIVRDSTFIDNEGLVIIVSDTVPVEIRNSTFEAGDGGALSLSGGAAAVIEDVVFTDLAGTDRDPGLVYLIESEATLTRVTFEGCRGETLVYADGIGALTLIDVVGTDNHLAGSAIAVRGTAFDVEVDGLDLVRTQSGRGPVVDLSGIVRATNRVRILGTTSLDAALAVTDQRQVPVKMHNLLIAGHLGQGLRLSANVEAKWVTVVGASTAIVQQSNDLLILDSSFLVDNTVGIELEPAYSPSIHHTWVFGNGTDTTLPVSEGIFTADPEFVTWDPSLDWSVWDLHLTPISPGVDGGDPTFLDPDGTTSDVGFYAGPAAVPWYYDDLDGDTLPDGWEDLWGGALDPTDDSDVDGVEALDEYLSGTSPTVGDTDGDGASDRVDGWPLDLTRF